jgi:hypothetical protein
VRLHALMHPIAPTPVEGYFLYNYLLNLIDKVLHGNAFAYTLLATIAGFLQAIYLNSVARRNKLFLRTGYIPAFCYLVFSSIFPSFCYFGLALLINFCMTGALDILLHLGQTLQPRRNIFNAGFVICLSGLLQYTTFSYFMLLLICMIVLRPFNLSEWIVAILGYLTPIYFLVSILFLIDKTSLILHVPAFNIIKPFKSGSMLYVAIMLSGVSILFLFGIYALQTQLSRISVYVRRNWIAILAYFIISIFASIITTGTEKETALITIPALALVISIAINIEKSKWFSNFAFYFSILLLIFCQWAFK